MFLTDANVLFYEYLHSVCALRLLSIQVPVIKKLEEPKGKLFLIGKQPLLVAHDIAIVPERKIPTLQGSAPYFFGGLLRKFTYQTSHYALGTPLYTAPVLCSWIIKGEPWEI